MKNEYSLSLSLIYRELTSTLISADSFIPFFYCFVLFLGSFIVTEI
jgi:hypothetical protein